MKSTRITVRLNENQIEQLNNKVKYANAESVSEVIRMAIDFYLQYADQSIT